MELLICNALLLFLIFKILINLSKLFFIKVIELLICNTLLLFLIFKILINQVPCDFQKFGGRTGYIIDDDLKM